MLSVSSQQTAAMQDGIERPGARRRNGRLRLLGVVCAVLGLPAQAAQDRPGGSGDLMELSLQELMQMPVETVYGASKYWQKVTEAPASVSIVTSDEIRRYGYRTLADALRSVRGLYVSDDRNYAYLGTRGFLRPGDYNTRVLVLVDGHRMNDNVYDSVYFARECMLDVDLVDRVEFVRGPGSSIYGSNAFFGVVNIVTKPVGRTSALEVSGEAGSFGARKARLSYGAPLHGGLTLSLSGSYSASDGQGRLYYPEFDPRISDNPLATNDGIARDIDAEESAQLVGSVRYGELTLSGFVSQRTKEIPTASFGTLFNDGREATTDERAYLDLRYDHAFAQDLRLLAQVSYDSYGYFADYPFDYAASGDPADIVVNKDETRGEWLSTEWRLTGKLFDQHTVLLGGELRENLREKQLSYDDVEPRYYYVDSDRRSRSLGLFAQGEFKLRTNLRVNAGLRYDQYLEGFGGTLNPRAALIYALGERTTLKALYGHAFRAPNAYERFYFPAQRTQGELEPEKIRTYELALEHHFDHAHRLSVSAYRYNVKDLITQSGDPQAGLYFENVSRVSASGIELEAEGKYESGVHARASYAFQRTRDEAGIELSSSPRHLAKLNLILPLHADRLFAGLEFQYHGAVQTLSDTRVGDFLVSNLTVSGRVARGVEVSAGVYNLLDAQYGYPGSEDHAQSVIPQDGRAFRVQLNYKR